MTAALRCTRRVETVTYLENAAELTVAVDAIGHEESVIIDSFLAAQHLSAIRKSPRIDRNPLTT